MIRLSVEPLTKETFAPFGEVIETQGAEHFPINQGTTERFHGLAAVDVDAQGGSPIISIFEGNPRPSPIKLEVMERHPLGTQAFFPLQANDWLVVVARSDADPLDPENLKAFRATGTQGVNYARNVWHHPLLVLNPKDGYLIIDRKGDGDNLEERFFEEDVVLEI